jgi:diacylglycerol kinase (ATP)
VSAREFLVVMNATAGNTDEATVERAVKRLEAADADVDIGRAGTPEELDGVLDGRRDRIVAVAGGDGSLHVVIDALRRRRELGDVVIGLLPLGTGNDFARGTGIPLDPESAAAVLMGVDPAPVDLLVDSTGRIVVNAVHLGVGVDAARRASALKSRFGRAAFAIGAVIAGARTPGFRMDVLVDGRVVVDRRRRVLMVAVGNASTIGGGTPVLPDAVIDDGQLDVMVSYAIGRWTRLGYALHLKRGVHPQRADVREVRGRRVTVRAHDFWCNADGELYGPESDVTWHVEPKVFRLLLPPRSEPSTQPD